MKAIAFNTPGDPDVLEVMELPDPEVGPGEVLIRVQATAVSPVDTSVRARKRADDGPIVVGMDAAGVVEDIDEAADTALTMCDKVLAVEISNVTLGGFVEMCYV